MATFNVTEVGVRAMVQIVRDPATQEVRLLVTAESILDDGSAYRRKTREDITDLVNQSARDGAASLLTNVENRLKQLWNI